MSPREKTNPYIVIQRILATCAALLGGQYVLLWPSIHHQELNRQLITAVKTHDTKSALLALSGGADGNVRDEDRVSPWIVIWNTIRGNKKYVSNAPTPLVLLLHPGSSNVDHPALVQALLEHGALVDVHDSNEITPLLHALDQGKTQSAKLLIEHGANVTYVPRQDVIAGLPWQDELTMAINLKDPGLVGLIISHGADPNGVAPYSMNTTPLAQSIMRNDPATVKALLQRHADPNFRSHFVHLDTTGAIHRFDAIAFPIQWAEKYNLRAIAAILKEAGATQSTKPMKDLD